MIKGVFVVIVLLALANWTFADTFVIKGIPCHKCRIDCLQEPNNIFKQCTKTRYVEYGCHVNDLCLSLKTATDREVQAGIAMCILQGGCVLKDSIAKVSDASYNLLVSQSEEGRMVQQLQDQINAQKAQLSTARTNQDVSLQNILTQTLANYTSQINQLEAKYIASAGSDLLLQGKRKALSLLNIGSSFFILYMLGENMRLESDKWSFIFTKRVETDGSKTSAWNIVFNEERKRNRFAAAKAFAETCKKLEPVRLEKIINYAKTAPKWTISQLDNARTMLTQYYALQPICQFPEIFLSASGIVENLLDEDFRFKTVEVFNAMVPTSATDSTHVSILHDEILKYADAYSKGAYKSPAALNALNAKLLAIGEQHCTRTLCSYTCGEYIDDSKISNCNVVDFGAKVYSGLLKQKCPLERAFISEAKNVEASSKVYCNSALRNKDLTQQVCYAESLYNSMQNLAIFKKREPRAVFSANPSFNDKLKFKDEVMQSYTKCLVANKALGSLIKVQVSVTPAIVTRARSLLSTAVSGINDAYFVDDFVSIVTDEPSSKPNTNTPVTTIKLGSVNINTKK